MFKKCCNSPLKVYINARIRQKKIGEKWRNYYAKQNAVEESIATAKTTNFSSTQVSSLLEQLFRLKQLRTKATSTRTERNSRPTKQFHFGNNFLVPYGHFIGLIRLINLMQLKAVSTDEKFSYGEPQ